MVHKKINYVLILLVVFGLTSCKKLSKEYTTVEFSIINPADGSPFVGVPVKIIEREAKNVGPKSSEVWSGKTDGNGKVIYEFKAAKRNGYWYIPIIDESYFGNQKNWVYTKRPAINWDPITKDKYNKMEYEITYYGYLQERFVNENCEEPTDSVFIKVLPTVPDMGGLIRELTLTGCFDMKTEGGKSGNPPGYFKIAMGLNIYEYHIKRENGGVIYGKDSVFVKPFELNEIEIKF